MAQYFLNVRDDEGFIADNEGIELDDDTAAKREADKAARELLADAVLSEKRIDAKRVEVRNERGDIIASVALKDLIH